ncbi:MAG: methylmalonyl-CoA carboxyltransferase [Promicromonosporaceae bacterium]|nr:methylmalonyl-CoA carboxyltransferase [Promicromonosporaceae bacterium]
MTSIRAPLAVLRALLDLGTFRHDDDGATHPDSATYDGVVTGTGQVGGRRVAVFAQDSSFRGGSIGAAHGKAIANAIRAAASAGMPIIGIWNGGGARLQEGVAALAAVGEIFSANLAARGRIPQISVILGPCAGAACYSPALGDFVIMVRGSSQMFLTGPAVTADVIGEHLPAERLGGCEIHAHNGVADLIADTPEQALAQTRNLLAYLSPPPSVSLTPAPLTAEIATLSGVGSPGKTYDIVPVLETIFDGASLLPLQPEYSPNIFTGLAKLEGQPVAVVASQPRSLAGALDAAATSKAAHFITTMTRLHLPIITLVDVPGFLPGVVQEKAGIIRAGASLVAAYLNSDVPKVTVILRKAFGGAYLALGSKAMGADRVLAWVNAEVAVMGAPGIVDITHRRELDALAIVDQNAATARREHLIAELAAGQDSLATALELGEIDEVITPEQTRDRLLAALSQAR